MFVPCCITSKTIVFWIFTFLVPGHLTSSYAQTIRSWDSFQNDRPALYAPAGVTSDDEIRAPVLMELTRDLVPANGPGGLYGVCARVYRVLDDIRVSPAEECRRHYNSRQAALGDISEFYQTLVESGRFNRSLEFPLADRFGRFAFRASFMYLSSKGNEPAVMFETASHSNQVLCVHSIKCPEPTTTSTLPNTVSPTTRVTTGLIGDAANSGISASDPRAAGGDTNLVRPTASAESTNKSPTQFWDTLLAGTEPRSWFLATVSLAILSLLLLIILLVMWLCLCRLRRQYARRRCRGACRFGCRCPPDVVRQSANSVAVYGPLDSQNTQLFHSPITPLGNGSVRSGSGFGATLFSGGTMTSSRWGSNGVQKLGSPLYVSLANAQDKSTLLAPTIHGSANVSMDTTSNAWAPNNSQHPSVHLHRRRLSQDMICRSTSEGSSVSSHPVPNPGTKPLLNYHGRVGLVSGFVGASNTSNGMTSTVQPTLLLNNVNTPQSMDKVGSIYYNSNLVGYPYADGGATEDISPGVAPSPNCIGGRKLADRNYYTPSLGSTGLVAEQELDRHPSSFFQGQPRIDKVPVSSEHEETCATFKSYGSDSLNPTYPMRGSEGEFLSITPPSGFYDLNGSALDSTLVSGSLNSPVAVSSPSTNVPPTNFSGQTYLSPVYPLITNPVNRNEWGNVSPKPSVSTSAMSSNMPTEMVGVVDIERNMKLPSSDLNRTNMSDKFMFKTGDTGIGTTSVPSGVSFSSKPLLTSRIYAASERML